MFGLLLADEGAADVSGQDVVDSDSPRSGHVSVKAWLTRQDVHVRETLKLPESLGRKRRMRRRRCQRDGRRVALTDRLPLNPPHNHLAASVLFLLP